MAKPKKKPASPASKSKLPAAHLDHLNKGYEKDAKPLTEEIDREIIEIDDWQKYLIDTGHIPQPKVVRAYPWRTQYNNKFTPQKRAKGGGPSNTVPGQAMSIQEIASRYAAGLTMQDERVPQYEGDENAELEQSLGIDPLKLDLSERYEILRTKMREANDKLRAYEENRNQKYKDKLKEDAVNEYKASLAQQQASQTPTAESGKEA